MEFNLQTLDSQQLDAAAKHYEDHGFIVLNGLEEAVTPLFMPVVSEAMELHGDEFAHILTPSTPANIFPPEIRQRLAHVSTSPELAKPLLAALEPLLTRLIGPIVHVSSNFHVQVKGGTAKAVDHGGYAPNSDYMEVHGSYLLHQDFSGATIPTSPSMLTLWVALNSCPYWNLRLYPDSHRKGLLCNKWLGLEDERLAPLGDPVDVAARVGTAILFNGLVLHGTSNPGPQRRISCNIRFFPLCGFLPSAITHQFGSNPARVIEEGLEQAPGDVVRAPLLEDQVFLGKEVKLEDTPPLSVLNWVNYIALVARGEMEEALPYLERFVNVAFGVDTAAQYISKFHGKPLYETTLRSSLECLTLLKE